MSYEIAMMLGLLGLTAFLFVSELVRIDLAGLIVLILLGWLQFVPTVTLFSGFSSNAVIAIIGVMIIGRGLDQAGITSLLVQPIVRFAGSEEKRLRSSISAMVGLISAFLQNIGAMAVFLPSVIRISRRTRIHLSRLLMPIGFAAILGGTLSMVGSSSLIVLNDFLRISGYETFGLFSVTPLGILLLTTGILFFFLMGNAILPDRKSIHLADDLQHGLLASWNLPEKIRYLPIPRDSELDGLARDDIQFWENYRLNLLGIGKDGSMSYAPGDEPFESGQVLVVLGEDEKIDEFIEDYGLNESKQSRYERFFTSEEAGFAELIVPPRSEVIESSIDAERFRETYGLEPIVLLTRDEEEHRHVSDENIQAGDTFLIHGPWRRIDSMVSSGDFISRHRIQSNESVETSPILAGLSFLLAMVLAVSGAPLSLSMITGAVGMIATGVIDMEDAYKSIDWKTVFLLASLIPMGIAMQRTGTAQYIAEQTITYVQGQPILIILTAVALLTSFFGLLMTNVAATVILVPMIIELGTMVNVDPRGLILLVGVCATNSFILPTHQVNALIMDPGDYKIRDFLTIGSGMSFIYLIVSVVYIYMVY